MRPVSKAGKVVARDCAQATQLKWNINAGERVSGKSAKVLKWILG